MIELRAFGELTVVFRFIEYKKPRQSRGMLDIIVTIADVRMRG